jgi:hypothetical protein
MVPGKTKPGAAGVRLGSKGHRPKAVSQAVTRAHACRRRWRRSRRLQRSKRRCRASSARMIEVRGERSGTAVEASDGSDGEAQAAGIMSAYNAFSPAEFQGFLKRVWLSLQGP